MAHFKITWSIKNNGDIPATVIVKFVIKRNGTKVYEGGLGNPITIDPGKTVSKSTIIQGYSVKAGKHTIYMYIYEKDTGNLLASASKEYDVKYKISVSISKVEVV